MKNGPREYHIDEEPLPWGTPVDYRYQLELMMRRRDAERDRNDRIDGKISVLIAGTIAAVGFSLEKLSSVFGILAAGAFLWPLFVLFDAYQTVEWKDAPEPQKFETSFPWYPKTTIREYAGAIVDSLKENTVFINAKALKVDQGLKALKYAIVIVIGLKVIDSLVSAYGTQALNYVEQRAKPPATAKPDRAAAARAGTPNARVTGTNRP